MKQEKELLEEHYQKHHKRGDRYGYLVCHGNRKPFLQNWIGKGKKILDLGCRDGTLTEAFVEGNHVTGVDIDRVALSAAKEHLPIDTLWADLNREWPFPENHYDVIVACEILEHLFYIETLLEQIHRSLKKGGLFVGSVPNSFRMRNRWKFFWGNEFDKDPTHVHRFSYGKLSDHLRKHFSTFSIYPIEGKVFPFMKVSPYTPKQMAILFAKMFLWKAEKE